MLVCGGKISDLGLDFANQMGLMVVRLTSKWDMRRLAKSIGATVLPRLSPPTPDEMGFCEAVKGKFEFDLIKINGFFSWRNWWHQNRILPAIKLTTLHNCSSIWHQQCRKYPKSFNQNQIGAMIKWKFSSMIWSDVLMMRWTTTNSWLRTSALSQAPAPPRSNFQSDLPKR